MWFPLCSWLLRDPELEIRSFSSSYLRAVDDYLSYLFSILGPLQVIVIFYSNIFTSVNVQ